MRPVRPPILFYDGWLFLLLMFSTLAALAQKTVVQDVGGGRKIESDYNSAGKVTEMRTTDSDGRLLEKIDYEYLPGYYGAQQTNISYWPDGKTVRSVTRVTYDPSNNFTGELVQVYDEASKQVGGHRLIHDPMTGVYRCAEWETSSQRYKDATCPSGEESGGQEEVKKFTYSEVMQHLEAARKSARQQLPKIQVAPPVPPDPLTSALNKEISIILPAQLQPGQRVSGSITGDPARYDNRPEVHVYRLTLPFPPSGKGTRLRGWTVEVSGEDPQSAAGPITFVVPKSGEQLRISFRQAEGTEPPITKLLPLSLKEPKAKREATAPFQSAALCVKGQLCTVTGPFTGDSSKTEAAFEERLATIVAETPHAAYIEVPQQTEAGSRPLFVAEGSKVVAFPTTIADFTIKNRGRKLEKGQTLIVFPTLDGPGDIPDALWRAGDFPAGSLERARKLPGFRMQRSNVEAGKEQELRTAKNKGKATKPDSGEILLVLTNPAPERISLRGAKDQRIVFHLTDESFKRGAFKYDLVVEALNAGEVDVKGYVIPLLAPVPGQEFPVSASTSGR